MAKVAVENDEQPSRCIVSSLNLLSFLAVIFALVLALHCDVLTVPPAIEQARGLWLQAAYLADSDFDFAGLQNEPASGEVSAYNYQAWKTSLPTLLALLMKALPTTQSVIVAYRSLTFLGAALIAVLVHSVVRPFTGRWLSILLVVCLLTNPAFSVQTEMLGMEIPLALCGMAAAWRLFSGGDKSAVAFGVLAVVAKVTGVINLLSIVASISANSGTGRSKSVRITIIGACLCGVIALSLLWRIYGREEPPSIAMAAYICPDVIMLFVAAMAMEAMEWLRTRRAISSAGMPAERAILTGTNRARLRFYCWLVVGLNLLVVIVVSFVVRYLAAAVPMLFVLIGTTRLRRSVVACVMFATIVWNVANRNGDFLLDLERAGRGFSSVPSLLERSREYLADHQVRLAFVRAAAAAAGDRPILTTYPYGYLLSAPRLGWVKEPAHGFSFVADSLYYKRFKHFDFRSSAAGLLPPDSLIAAISLSIPVDHSKEFPPIEPGDEVVFDVCHGARYACFVKQWRTSPPADTNLLAWAVKSGWTGHTGANAVQDALYFRFVVMRSMGLERRAISELARLLRTKQIDPSVHRLCLELLAGFADPVAAWPTCKEFADTSARAWASAACGMLALRAGDRTTAGMMFDRALTDDPREFDALVGAGIVRVLAGHLEQGETFLQAALALESRAAKQAEALRWLGEVRERQNRLDEAVAYYERALELNPELEQVRQKLQMLTPQS